MNSIVLLEMNSLVLSEMEARAIENKMCRKPLCKGQKSALSNSSSNFIRISNDKDSTTIFVERHEGMQTELQVVA